MKKTLMTTFFLVLSVSLQAQEVSDSETENVQFISMGLPGGLSFSYEQAFAKKFSLIGRAGLTGEVGYESDNFFGDDYWYYGVHPFAEVEPRYYYNLQKRVRKGKKTLGNAGSFWALRTGYVFKPMIKHNIDSDYNSFYVAPCWGLRRSWGKHWLFAFETGIGFGWNNYNQNNVGLLLGVNFGYKL